MAEIPFPRQNLNPAASNWARTVERYISSLAKDLQESSQSLESQGRTLAGIRGPSKDADGRIYRPNGIVVPQTGAGLEYADDGHTITGRTRPVPYTLFYGQSEDDHAGDYGALQVSPGQALLRANSTWNARGYSGVLTLDGGSAGSGDVFTGYLSSPARFAVEFGTTQNTTQSFEQQFFDPTALHWFARYTAAGTPDGDNGYSTFLSMADGLFEIDSSHWNLADVLVFAPVLGDDGVTVDHYALTLRPDVELVNFGGSGGGSSAPPASTTTPGIIEIATQGEVDTGTDTTRAVTPATLASYVASHGGTGGGSGPAFNLADAWKGEWVQP